MITLTGYWAERLEKNSMEEKELARATRLYLRKDEMADRYPEISFKLFEFMPNLRELMIPLDNVVDWSYLTHLTSLTRLTLSGKEIDATFVGYLQQLPKLRELHLTGGATVSDLDGLAGIKNIKCLILSGAKGFTSDTIRKFTHLTQLMVEENQEDLTDGIACLVKLTKLELKKTPVEHVYFLSNLKNLTEFLLHKKVRDQAIADVLLGLKKLKRLEYPLSDLSVIKACPKLIRICVDGTGYQNMDAIQNTEIVSIMVIDADSQEAADAIVADAKQYRELTSYGYNMPWQPPKK